MTMLRRRLAACALALLVCQSALVFAAPLTSCCPPRHASAESGRQAGEKDCCPAGAHAPGQCPLHARSKAATTMTCRMQCDAPHGVQFLIGLAGPLPSPGMSIAAPLASLTSVTATIDPDTHVFVPDSPPPRLR